MKTKFFTLCLVALLISSFSFATIRRVGYFGPAVAGVDYSNFQAAHNAATAGDTIMMHPGSNFGTVTMNKSLVVIGPGYFLSQNTALQANPIGMDSTASSNLIIDNAAASGSIFLGCTFSYNGINITGVGVANISFIRCWFNGIQGSASNFCVRLQQSINNFLFQQCAFKGDAIGSQNAAVVATNLAFFNCLFYSLPNTSIYSIYFSAALPHSGLLQNCVVSQGTNSNIILELKGTWAVNNCISNASPFTGSGITYQNNIGTLAQFPAGNGNQQNVPWANIFSLTGSQDAQYALKTGSPAIGAGISGINCGIFGGTTPYRLSGIPSVPTIYALSSPQGSTPTVNTVQINLSTRSNN